MKKEEEKKLEEQLHSQEKKIKEQLQHFKEGLDFGDDTDHLEEEADETEEFGTWLGLKRVLEHQLDRIRRALAKFGLGNYGRCEQCGKEIEARLLEADPESTLCINCKKITKRK
ncbi:MAG: TraR/DksA C4-type zinc finger protein [Candidatus Jorgensenbacteria bacterium]